MPVTLEDVSDVLLPRRYQEEIFSRAQGSNVIAALDTGTGKTYISTLLIKWIAARDAGLSKIIVFLVPKVALVEQQGDFIAKQTPLRVTKCCGATAIDLTDRVGWKKELESTDVLVLTAQIFLNILTHSHWSLEKVSLMVFDECHHTRKNHAYNGIMREYFQLPVEKRPKVFGMTASPIWNPRDAVESLATLERNLDAKVIAVRQHVDELMGHAPKPEELMHEYPPPLDIYPAYPNQTLWARLNLEGLPPEIDIPVEKIKTRYDVTYASLGPYGAELFLYMDIKQRIAQMVHRSSAFDIDYISIMYDPEGDIAMHTSLPPMQLPLEVQELQEALNDHKQYFEDEDDPDSLPTMVHLKWCSPKVRELIDILFAHYTSTFQGIVFVEQRHVAACLAKMLSRVPQLSHLIRSRQLIGHGAASLAKTQMKGMVLRTQQDIVKMFREREINLLIATSVAEEGLDFPACDLVIRFDPIQHMVGYLQSRGRARHRTSKFVIMVQQGHAAHMERYRAFSEIEPQLREVYQERDAEKEPGEIDDEPDDPVDIAERERYVVPHTGAVLTYNSAISLLNHLCSLIPHDKFTPVHLPKYSGDFTSTLQLPSSLPLPQEGLNYVGPTKHSKKEAKRAVAFMAVKRLHLLNVFDDYLLPTQSRNSEMNEDGDGRPIPDASKVPDMMQVQVRDPWTRAQTLYLHVVYLDGRRTAGLITGTVLPSVELVCRGTYVSTNEIQRVRFDSREEWRQRRVLEDYMRMGLWWSVTGRGITLPLTCYLVPITHTLQIDWDAIERAVINPYGISDWSSINEEDYFHTLVMCVKEPGRPLLLRTIRTDITPQSVPPEGSREGGFPTYRDYWLHRFTRKGILPEIPEDGPCLEAQLWLRHTSCSYSLDNGADDQLSQSTVPLAMLYPLSLCRRAEISEDIYFTFHVLPELCHRITDVYRARAARAELCLPPIADDLLIQALTLPSTHATFNNQRLETLGDSVLKLANVVHLYNKYPHRHEGQLDTLRRSSVSNRTLLSRAKEHTLERYLTSEPQSVRTWRYTMPPDLDPWTLTPHRSALRSFPRRSLQDCMEAILGASYSTGGMNMALRAGTALGLSFGGPLSWNARYLNSLPEEPVSKLFTGLQEALGYQFRCGTLLLEAATHPSFGSNETSSYQRLEFLGDALLDLVVIKYLYDKFPKANSGQLSWARSRAVCGPTQASIAVRRLGLHKLLLVNNVELSVAISRYVPALEGLTSKEVVRNAWKHDPPKAICDVFESVMGAVLVDSNYNLELAISVAENIMSDLLEVLTPDLPRDPISELMVWVARAGCKKIRFRKHQSRPETKKNDGISILMHEQTVVGPVIAHNLSLAKGLASERARVVLADPNSPYCLSKICDCGKEDSTTQATDESDSSELDDETTQGFAMLAHIVKEELEGSSEYQQAIDEDTSSQSEDDMLEELEVEDMMQVDDISLLSLDAMDDSQHHAEYVLDPSVAPVTASHSPPTID
ncbi:uncharacterized protein LAESUDRAFT_642494 [Laetiporus sulphureus 93-53]|uniref:P-loop containing nucleoside triphosphate hydrolase protein n=1 Tax=Laetiporus sulphureus 93-53 TaxID=1314785 RepID=A0A165H1E5_9APHY|nr:uncharacterized protein LAESUDRAFT_642494 [Laetiporus sulphureus 93-53]KZT11110.1 hypothetical protein LAESUDRAFT_642494 [Laetiporus sulphureus 93-53]